MKAKITVATGEPSRARLILLGLKHAGTPSMEGAALEQHECIRIQLVKRPVKRAADALVFATD
jgi:hypothetical protein